MLSIKLNESIFFQRSKLLVINHAKRWFQNSWVTTTGMYAIVAESIWVDLQYGSVSPMTFVRHCLCRSCEQCCVILFCGIWTLSFSWVAPSIFYRFWSSRSENVLCKIIINIQYCISIQQKYHITCASAVCQSKTVINLGMCYVLLLSFRIQEAFCI